MAKRFLSPAAPGRSCPPDLRRSPVAVSSPSLALLQSLPAPALAAAAPQFLTLRSNASGMCFARDTTDPSADPRTQQFPPKETFSLYSLMSLFEILNLRYSKLERKKQNPLLFRVSAHVACFFLLKEPICKNHGFIFPLLFSNYFSSPFPPPAS